MDFLKEVILTAHSRTQRRQLKKYLLKSEDIMYLFRSNVKFSSKIARYLLYDSIYAKKKPALNLNLILEGNVKKISKQFRNLLDEYEVAIDEE